MFNIALQLYSLREQCDRDLDGVLERLALAGYDGVEPYTLYDLTARQMKDKLDGAGLACPSAHIGLERFRADIDAVIADAATLGASFVTIPWTDLKTEAEVFELAAFVRENAAKIRTSGLKWLYHNHAGEFRRFGGSRDFFDILLENTDKTQINLQVDTYWAEQAGTPIKDFIMRTRERIGCFHLKDSREIGAGSIDFPSVLDAAKELGHKWLIVEQEEFDIDPYESVRISLENVKKLQG